MATNFLIQYYQEQRKKMRENWKLVREHHQYSLPCYFHSFLRGELELDESDIEELERLAHLNGYRVNFSISTVPTEQMLVEHWFVFTEGKRKDYSVQQLSSFCMFSQKLHEYCVKHYNSAPLSKVEEKKRSLFIRLITFSWCSIV